MRQELRFLAACVALTPLTALSAPTKEIMQSRYLRSQFCMEKIYGQGYYQRLHLDSVVNRWGVSEPTLRSLMTQPLGVQWNEASCRKQNGIEKELRPR